jgi:hypothetical protein
MTNFVLANTSKQNNYTIFNGTETISMPQGVVSEIPIGIKVMKNTLGVIQIDPNKIDNHFGNSLIYGIPLEDSKYNKNKLQ